MPAKFSLVENEPYNCLPRRGYHLKHHAESPTILS